MFERFTERARQVVVLAQDESRSLKHHYIGTEHLLLGLLREEEGIAARVLTSLGISLEDVRAEVAQLVGPGDDIATGQVPFTPRAKEVLELALEEGLSLGHNYIGTEHVLLGLVREHDGVAARILDSFGAEAVIVRDEVINALSGGAPGERTLERQSVIVQGVNEWQENAMPLAGSLAGDERRPLLLAIGLAAASFPLGLLVGWLIWG